MLDELITELSFDFSLLVKDEQRARGHKLMKSLIQAARRQGSTVIVLDTDLSALDSSPNCAFIDICAQTDHELMKQMVSYVPQSNANCIVVCTSISLLIMNNSVAFVAKLMRTLKINENVKKVISLFHKDVKCSEEASDTVEYMFDSVVDLLPVTPSLKQLYHGYAKCRRYKSSGKLDMSDEYFKLNSDFEIVSVHESTSAAIQSAIERGGPDVTSNLTFNLKLSDDERKAKNSLQLPYIKKKDERDALLNQTAR